VGDWIQWKGALVEVIAAMGSGNTISLSNVAPASAPPVSKNEQKIASNSDAIANLQNGLAYIVGNTNATGVSLAVGQYVYVKGHSTIPEGLRKVKGSSAIANGDSITTNNTEACSEGGLNALNSIITTVNDKVNTLKAYKYYTSTMVNISAYGSSSNLYTAPSDGYVRVENSGDAVIIMPGEVNVLEANGKVATVLVHKETQLYVSNNGSTALSARFIPLAN
jgi:hypothetical protein